MNLNLPAQPCTKPLFLALHPPRRVWPGLTTFYIAPAWGKGRARD